MPLATWSLLVRFSGRLAMVHRHVSRWDGKNAPLTPLLVVVAEHDQPNHHYDKRGGEHPHPIDNPSLGDEGA